MSESMGLVGSGVRTFVDGKTLEKRMSAFEKDCMGGGTDHVWVFTIMHRLSDGLAAGLGKPNPDVPLFDLETVVMAGGPMCYRCETVEYTTHPCPGYQGAVHAS